MFLLGLASGYTLNKPDKKCYPIGSLTTRSIMANPLKSMEFLKRKAEELRGKGARRVQGTHPVPGSRPRQLREGDDLPPQEEAETGGGGQGGE